MKKCWIATWITLSARLASLSQQDLITSRGVSANVSLCAFVANSKLKLEEGDCQSFRGVVEIPDEGGSNPVVLVAPIKGFPLKPREQLPHRLKHICHRCHDRGNNHLGGQSAISSVRTNFKFAPASLQPSQASCTSR